LDSARARQLASATPPDGAKNPAGKVLTHHLYVLGPVVKGTPPSAEMVTEYAFGTAPNGNSLFKIFNCAPWQPILVRNSSIVTQRAISLTFASRVMMPVAAPDSGTAPFNVACVVASSPWLKTTYATFCMVLLFESIRLIAVVRLPQMVSLVAVTGQGWCRTDR